MARSAFDSEQAADFAELSETDSGWTLSFAQVLSSVSEMVAEHQKPGSGRDSLLFPARAAGLVSLVLAALLPVLLPPACCSG